MKIEKRPTLLMILDGFGLNRKYPGNAVELAHKPHLDSIFKTYPMSRLMTSGSYVGLPDGQMGNSEVGHLNIGAGRIVYQELSKISRAIDDGSFFENTAFKTAMEYTKQRTNTLHLLGLLSDGGVHSHIDHLKALIKLAKMNNIEKVYVHALLDGRDVPPKCAMKYLDEINSYMNEIGLGTLATLGGRYYAMDRDNRWDRVKKGFDAICKGEGKTISGYENAIDTAYASGESDEFVTPTVVNPQYAGVNDGDAFIMFNFRPDRAREITRAFTEKNFDGFSRDYMPNISYVTMTCYDASLSNVTIAYPPESPKNTLGEYISSLGLAQLRIAETEKYAHVTFFFNGGKETPYEGEDRILVPSPKVATYDLKPEMSAYEVTDKVTQAIESDKYDLIILNFANSDMVGHTGNIDAAIKAVEALDNCVEEIKNTVLSCGGQIFLTADHGNADEMLDEKGGTLTAHSLNPVPFVHISGDPAPLKDRGKLADIAPTLLTLMGLAVPEEMTGEILIK